MEKKAYSEPAIVRVKLNPEQAVLSACSTGNVTLSNNRPGGGCLTTGDCRLSTSSRTNAAGVS